MLSVIRNGKKYIVYHIDEAGILPMSDGSLIQGNLEHTVSGLLLMAYMDSVDFKETWRKRLADVKLPAPGCSEKELKLKCQAIRSQGYAHRSISDNNTEAFAFGVFQDNSIVASVGILCCNDPEKNDLKEKMIYYGIICAKEITRRLNRCDPFDL